MRTARNWALGFAIANLVLGALALFAPAVKSERIVDRLTDKVNDVIPGRKRSLINTRSGTLLGFLGAVNPMHGFLHLGLGALGLSTRMSRGLSRPYLALLGLLYGVLAVMGWKQIGFKPGIHNMAGMAVDRVDNIVHTALSAAAFSLAAYAQPQKMLEDAHISGGRRVGGVTPSKKSIKKVGVGG